MQNNPASSVWRRAIQAVAIVLLATYSVSSIVQRWSFLRATWKPELAAQDSVTGWEQRVSRIRLPANVGNEVGYLADWDIDPGYDPIGQDEEYVLTQYALAPLIVKRGDANEWIVANLTRPGADDWLRERFRNAKIHYYGWGIYLIHKLEQ